MANSITLPPDHQPEPGILDTVTADNPRLTRLVKLVEEADEAQRPARERAERDRDYRDGKQLTDEEVRALNARGQPAVAFNVIADRADFLAGMEKKQRRDPKAYPRNNPQDAPAADAFTDAMRYVVERADYPSKRSQAWENLVAEGYGGIELSARPARDGSMEIQITHIPWDRMFYDPHSSAADFSDAQFIGQFAWMDYDEALDRALSNGMDEAQAKEVLASCFATSGAGKTFDDKPRTAWLSKDRKRARIVMMWYMERGEWEYCEFTKGGELTHVVAPYVDQDGDSYCPWIIESANVDRENNRFGELRKYIDAQDEINKRRSKEMHNSMSRGVIASEGAVADINAARREFAKPDFWVTKLPGGEIEVVDGLQGAAYQAQMLREAMEYVRQTGANEALQGKGVNDQSGRAIEAQQAGGIVQQSRLMDTLRRFDWRTFNVIASMIKQWWDRETWIRVTDDEDVPKWVGLNEPMWTDPTTGETKPESEWQELIQNAPPEMEIPQLEPAVDPETGEPMLNNHIARLDMDIIVSDAPDQITLAGEDWQAMTQMLSLNLSPERLKLAIEMHPSLPSKRKKQFVEMIDREAQAPPPPGAEDSQRLQKELLEAKVADTRGSAYVKLTTGERNMAQLGAVAMPPPRPDVAEGFDDAQMGHGPEGQGPPGMGPGGPPQGGMVGMMTGGMAA